jgi:transposase InsO family protein
LHLWYWLFGKNQRQEVLIRMTSIRQIAQFRLRVVRHALKTGNVSSTARLHRVSRQSVHRWIARYDGTLESLMDRSHRPHRHPTQHTSQEVAQVLRVQRHNKRLGLVCLWVHLKMNYGYCRTQTALYKLLRREDILPGPRKRARRKPKPYEPILVPGERFQIDVKHVPKVCLVGGLSTKKLYQYTAIDECTRWRHIAVFDEISTYSSVEFAYQLLERFPFEIGCIQTDNGAEFTSKYTGSTHPSAFESELAALGIRHKLIAPATPRHNGKVERSHRTDQERFYNDRRFFSLKYLKEQMSRYLRESNRRPLMAHGWKSAQQMLENYQHVV